MSSFRIAAFAACLFVSSAVGLAQTVVQGQEPNNSKAEATLAPGLQTGDALAAYSCSGTALNFFRASTAPAAPGIYRHTLANTDFDSAYVRLFGEDAIEDAVLPGSLALLQDPPTGQAAVRFTSWYGFGKSEELYVELQSANVCRASGRVALTTEAITPVDLGSVPVNSPGLNVASISLSVSRVSFDVTVDPSYQLFDAEFRAMPAHGIDDPFSLNSDAYDFINLPPGRYYLAAADGEISTHLPPHRQSGEADSPAAATDFNGVVVNRNGNAGTELRVRFWQLPPTNYTKADPYDILWYTFVVEGQETVSVFCEGDGSIATCPCGTDASLGSGQGCPNSTGRGASIMTWPDRASASEFAMSAFDLPAGQFAMPFVGLGAQSPVSVSGGLYCIGAGGQRLVPVLIDSAGSAEWQYPLSTIPGAMAGQSLLIQAAYRDPAAAGGCQINLTSGTAVRL